MATPAEIERKGREKIRKRLEPDDFYIKDSPYEKFNIIYGLVVILSMVITGRPLSIIIGIFAIITWVFISFLWIVLEEI